MRRPPGRGAPHRWGARGSAVRLVIGGLDLGGDPAAVADLVAVVASPRADGAEVGLAAGALGCRAAGRPATAGALGVTDPDGEVVTQLRGVVRGQVDLVADAVERERNGLVGRGALVDVVDEEHLDLLCHGFPFSGFFPEYGTGKWCPPEKV